MSRVTVVTDTTHYLPRELCDAQGVEQVSLYVNWSPRGQERQDKELDLPDFDAFYDHLRVTEELPTTSQPSIGDFIEVYEPLVAAGRDIVSIHISGGISGTVESARQAAQRLVEEGSARAGQIEIVDSRSACGGQGFVLLAAAALAAGGGDVEAVAARARTAMDEVKIWFCVDTLEFLRRGGRIGGAQAWIGGALKIKPILTMDGEITPVERVRTQGRAFERMVEYLQSRRDDGCDVWAVQHIQASEQLERLIERGRAIFGCEPHFASEIGPVIGTHVGPGLMGVSGMRSELLAPR